MSARAAVVAALLALLIPTSAGLVSVVSKPLNVAAFNVQRFGTSKMSNPAVRDVLVRLLSEYDITLVQEIVDASGTAIRQLTQLVSAATGHPYGLALSPRVGQNSPEQYGYVYRKDRVQLVAAGLYPDPQSKFTRTPYVAKFALRDVRYLNEFTLVGIHTKPTAAAAEIDALSDVLDFVRGQLAANDVILLGDFNAGCNFVTQQQWANNRLKHRTDVYWAIADYTATNIGSNNCAYDRFVLSGINQTRALVDDSSGPFRYDKAWGISSDLTKAVSDHYPVRLQLKPKVVTETRRNLFPMAAFAVMDRRGASQADIMALTTATDTAGFDVRTVKDRKERALVGIEAIYGSYKPSGEEILSTLIAFHAKFPTVVTDYDLGLLQYKIFAGALDDPTVYDAPQDSRWYCHISCFLADSRCRVTVEKTSLVA